MKRLIYLFAVPLLLLAVTIYASQRPYYNWDMFPYMALTIFEDTIPFDSTHARIYQEAVMNMPASDFGALSLRQRHLQESSQAFKDILKYYEIKPGYLLAVELGYGLGLNLLMATYMPSILCYFLLCCLLFVWFQKLFPLPVAAISTLLMAVTPFLIQAARYSSPDMMCAFLTLAGLFLISEYSIGLGLLLCGLAIPVRPDSIILFMFITFVLFRTKKITLSRTLAISTAALALTLFALRGPGILLEFLYSDAPYSDSWNITEMLQHYLISLKAGLSSVIQSHTTVFIFFAAVVLYQRMKAQPIFHDQWSLLILAACSTLIARYLLHPVIEDRFVISCYLIIIIGFSKTVSNPISPKPIRTLP